MQQKVITVIKGTFYFYLLLFYLPNNVMEARVVLYSGQTNFPQNIEVIQARTNWVCKFCSGVNILPCKKNHVIYKFSVKIDETKKLQ